ncbi:right-handed parallel beta-helix repeat-containing protein [Streptomyces himalayensis]|uniref:Right-handed parallel beta-helix repeat-containing protein n=1 Tax=Streptomyces himalayensis subsp. himalayensis TaxID=2756131 RepID=A0A7W0ID84_9ACTN|nr:right-handed parallel beta-helix repeat-containing protein [Streptomyces himalayensis]MBA2951438.1 right-handed parallel beta-helix repeat-containing protein [Streptomyces himalayensis subsp. himalayensis]
MVTKPTRGQHGWDTALNAALDDLQSQITTNLSAEVFNVLTYGAVGNGASDDTAAIQAALNAATNAGGGTVFLSAGRTYCVTDYLVPKDNTVVWAYGATVKAIGNKGILRNFGSAESFTVYNGPSNITIAGGTWDGNASDGVTGTVTNTVNVFTFGHARNITVRDAKVTNVSSAHAMDVNACDTVRILNCRFEGFRDNTGDASRPWSEAIQIDWAITDSGIVGANDNTPCKNILVQGCSFGAGTRLPAFGRAVGSHTSVNGAWADGIQVLGNRIEGTAQEGVRAYAWKNAVIADNVISGTGLTGIMITGPDPAVAGYNMPCQYVTVQGNVVAGPASASANAIRVSGFSAAQPTGVHIADNTVTGGTATGIFVSQASNPTVASNQAISPGTSGIYVISCVAPLVTGNKTVSAGGTAIGVDTCTGGHASGNFVQGGSSHGILIAGGSDISATGNRVWGVTSSGIRATSTSLRPRITANTVLRNGVSALGIEVTASATGGMVIGNDLSGSSWPGGTALSLPGTPATDWAGGTTNPGNNLVS